MTTNPSPPPPPVPPVPPAPAPPVADAQAKDGNTPPLRILLTILELAALGAIGTGVISVLAGALGVGVGLLFAFGIGAIVLVGVVYGLFGVAGSKCVA